MEAKLEELGKICPNKKDASFNLLQFCIHGHFLSVQSLRRYKFFKKIMFVPFFFSPRKSCSHIAGLMEAKPEELGTILPNKKDVPFYVLQFCIYANFLSVQPLRRYEFFKK